MIVSIEGHRYARLVRRLLKRARHPHLPQLPACGRLIHLHHPACMSSVNPPPTGRTPARKRPQRPRWPAEPERIRDHIGVKSTCRECRTADIRSM
jgi:hypothetical protein